MATNIQLELQLKQLREEVLDLRRELESLKAASPSQVLPQSESDTSASAAVAAVAADLANLIEALDKTFRGNDEWHDHKPRKVVNGRDAAAKVNEVAPTVPSVVPSSNELSNIAGKYGMSLQEAIRRNKDLI